jgi:hypothetical protein
VDDTTQETVYTHSVSKARAREKAKANDNVTTAARQSTSPENAPISRKAKANEKVFKEKVPIVARKAVPNGNARTEKEESQEEKETASN